MSKKPTVAQIVASLELVARFYGWGVLYGAEEPPTREDLENILVHSKSAADLGVRIMGGKSVPEAERLVMYKEISTTAIDVIESVGGWQHVKESTLNIKKETPREWWRVVADYVMYIRPGGIIRSGSGTGGMASRLFGADGKYSFDQRTARNWMRRLLRLIATRMITCTPDGDISLSSQPFNSGAPR